MGKYPSLTNHSKLGAMDKGTLADRATAPQQALQRLRMRQGANGWPGARNGGSGC